MNDQAKKHLSAAASYIAVAESGDAKLAAYRQAADEIAAAQYVEPTISQREIGERIGKSRPWVGQLVRWRTSGYPDSGPFDGPGQKEARRRLAERREPTDRADRVEMASRLLADPEVAKAAIPAVLAKRSKSQRLIEQAVSRKNADERKRQVDAARRRRDGEAAPLPAYMAKMVVKINEWAAALASIEGDLEQLPDGRGREMVLDVLRELASQTQRCIDRLERPGVIEGRAA